MKRVPRSFAATPLFCASVAAVCVLVLSVPVGVNAQPGDERRGRAAEAGEEGRDAAGPQQERRVMRTFLQRRLSEARSYASRLEDALERLDSGEDLREIRADLRDAIGDAVIEWVDEHREAREAHGRVVVRRRDRDLEEPPRRLSDEQHRALREIITAVMPDLRHRMDRLAESDPEEADRRMREMFPRFRPLIELREEDTEVFRMRLAEIATMREAVRLSREIARKQRRGADADELQSDHAALRALLEQHFEMRRRAQQHELDRLKERLRVIEKELEEHDRDRERLVEDRIESLLERAATDSSGRHGPADGRRFRRDR